MTVLETPSNHSWENATLDVINKGCFGNFDTVACIRNGLLSALAFATFLRSVLRIVQLHLVKHPQAHQYIIFYFASVESVLLGVWLVLGKNLPQLEFSAAYLKQLQFIVVCHFHWALASRILHKQKLIKRVVFPVLALCCVYFSTITVLATVYPKSSWVACMDPYWLMLSVPEFLVVQQFVITGAYITRKINAVSALESFKREQKRDLWSVIAVYELSALVALLHDSTVRIVGNEVEGCSAIYGHMQVVFSSIFSVIVIIRYLLPIWAMIIVFRPTPGCMSSDEERLLGWSNSDGSNTSTFSPSPSRGQHFYKPLQSPEGGSPVSSPTWFGSAFVVRRAVPAPTFLPNVARPPLLTPISEEENASSPVASCPCHSPHDRCSSSSGCRHSCDSKTSGRVRDTENSINFFPESSPDQDEASDIKT